MGFHNIIFLVGKPCWLIQNPVGNTYFADIVQYCYLSQVFALFFAVTKLFCNHNRILRYSDGVLACILVLCVNRLSNGKNGFVAHFYLILCEIKLHFLHTQSLLDLRPYNKPCEICDRNYSNSACI